MKNVAVILSGCGVFDGAEIQEAVLSLWALAKHGTQYQCFAPDIPQHHVINHLTGEEMTQESRNVLVEAARIARGAIKPLNQLEVAQFDALLLPGGFGVAKNLSDFAFNGADCTLNDEVRRACLAFAEAGKAAGYMCIAPALIPRIYPATVKATIGTDTDTAAALNAMGADHVACGVDGIVTDGRFKLVSTPAYMLAQNIAELGEGIDRLVAELLALA